jgi:hypothetical protein
VAAGFAVLTKRDLSKAKTLQRISISARADEVLNDLCAFLFR